MALAPTLLTGGVTALGGAADAGALPLLPLVPLLDSVLSGPQQQGQVTGGTASGGAIAPGSGNISVGLGGISYTPKTPGAEAPARIVQGPGWQQATPMQPGGAPTAAALPAPTLPMMQPQSAIQPHALTALQPGMLPASSPYAPVAQAGIAPPPQQSQIPLGTLQAGQQSNQAMVEAQTPAATDSPMLQGEVSENAQADPEQQQTPPWMAPLSQYVPAIQAANQFLGDPFGIQAAANTASSVGQFMQDPVGNTINALQPSNLGIDQGAQANPNGPQLKAMTPQMDNSQQLGGDLARQQAIQPSTSPHQKKLAQGLAPPRGFVLPPPPKLDLLQTATLDNARQNLANNNGLVSQELPNVVQKYLKNGLVNAQQLRDTFDQAKKDFEVGDKAHNIKPYRDVLRAQYLDPLSQSVPYQMTDPRTGQPLYQLNAQQQHVLDQNGQPIPVMGSTSANQVGMGFLGRMEEHRQLADFYNVEAAKASKRMQEGLEDKDVLPFEHPLRGQSYAHMGSFFKLLSPFTLQEDLGKGSYKDRIKAGQPLFDKNGQPLPGVLPSRAWQVAKGNAYTAQAMQVAVNDQAAKHYEDLVKEDHEQFKKYNDIRQQAYKDYVEAQKQYWLQYTDQQNAIIKSNEALSDPQKLVLTTMVSAMGADATRAIAQEGIESHKVANKIALATQTGATAKINQDAQKEARIAHDSQVAQVKNVIDRQAAEIKDLKVQIDKLTTSQGDPNVSGPLIKQYKDRLLALYEQQDHTQEKYNELASDKSWQTQVQQLPLPSP